LARSNSKLLLLDRLALVGITLGLASYVAPFWNDGRLGVAFWLTFAATLLHIFTSHVQADPEEGGSGS
jgi:hypothetical protein